MDTLPEIIALIDALRERHVAMFEGCGVKVVLAPQPAPVNENAPLTKERSVDDRLFGPLNIRKTGAASG